MTLFQLIKKYSTEIKNGRDPASILSTAASEFGELAQEVNARFSKSSYKNPGKDGIVGEAVDTIIAVVDLVCQCYPRISEEQLLGIAEKKLEYWRSLDAAHREERNASRKAKVVYEFPGGPTVELEFLSNGEGVYAIRAADGRLCCNRSAHWEEDLAPQDPDDDFVERARWASLSEAIGFYVLAKDKGWLHPQIPEGCDAGFKPAQKNRRGEKEK